MGCCAVQSPFDLLAKGLLEAGLSPACDVSLQVPVTPDTRYADAVVMPRPEAAALLASRGLLGRLGMAPAVIEPFSRAPDERDVHLCVARASLLRAERGIAFALWVIAPRAPQRVIEGWRLHRARGEPRGVWCGASPLAPSMVETSALPRTRDTLLLRLMGRDAVFRDALRDVTALPEDAWERAFVPRLILRVRRSLRRMGADGTPVEEWMRFAEIDPEADALIDSLLAAQEARGRAEGEARGRAEGEARGRADALRVSVLAMCEVLDVALDNARRASIAAAGGDELAAMLDTLRRTRALP